MSPKQPSERPVTVRDIAAAVGVSAAAVSLALRNSPQVSEGLRARVRDTAERMGWRPNPLLAAYQAQVRALKPVKFQASIGWLIDHPDEQFWERPWNRALREGARALGFALDEIWLPGLDLQDAEGNAMKYRRILMARGLLARSDPSDRSDRSDQQKIRGRTFSGYGPGNPKKQRMKAEG